MRAIESLILLAILLSLLGYLVPKSRRPRWLFLLPALAALFIVIHLLVEGYRWQMVPAYALGAIVVLGMVAGRARRANSQSEAPSLGRRIAAIIGVVAGLFVLALATAIPVLSPVFSLPEPTGTHAVGTQYAYWIDEERPDELATEPGGFREISVQIWYPAEPSRDEKPIRYMSQEAARTLTHSWNVPDFLFDHHALVHTHAYLGAEVAESGAPFPVITYSTSGLMSSHMALFEELASNGYVVLCIGHPYWNPYVYGSDGEVLPFDGQIEYYQEWYAEDANVAVDAARSEVVFAKSTAAQKYAHRKHNEMRPLAIRDLRLWADDVGFVLDKVEEMNQGSGLLAGALDLNRAGIMGFSKGGATAGQFCLTDERCKAGVNLTGLMYGDIVDANLDGPFFFISEEGVNCPDCYVNDLFYKRAESDAYQMKIKGARHTSFGDPCLWGELLKMSDEEPGIECERMVQIQNVYTLAFFDKHLKGMASPLLDGPSADFPETVFKSKSNASRA